MDMHYIHLLLPFILEGLLTEEVVEYKQTKSLRALMRIFDPRPDMVQIVIIVLSWYGLYRRRIPAKDKDDIQDLDTLGHRYI